MSDKQRKRPGYDAEGEMTGQLSLFTIDGADEYIQRWFDDEGDGDEVCKECGHNCTSSKECAEFSGTHVREQT